jgi:hypothetical protein
LQGTKVSLALEANGEPLPVNPGSQTISGLFDTENYSPALFQIGDRDLVEEAASFDSSREYREYAEATDSEPVETVFMSEEEKAVWYETFWQKSKKAVGSYNRDTAASQGRDLSTAAAADEEFLRLINEPGNLEDFAERAARLYSEDYGEWQAADETEAEFREQEEALSGQVRRKLAHPSWTTVFASRGKIGPTQRKQLSTLIERSPREYRDIYSRIMDRPDLAVKPEDSQAEALKHRIKDSRREEVENLTPEKMRRLAADINREDFAEKVRTGRAKLDEPGEKEYIRDLENQVKEAREALDELKESQDEDNNFLEKRFTADIIKAHERLIEAKNSLDTVNAELERAVKQNSQKVEEIARRAGRVQASYNSLERDFKAVLEEHDLELEVRETLTSQRFKEALDSAKKQSRMAVKETRAVYKEALASARKQNRFAVKAARAELQAHIDELNRRRKAVRELNAARRGLINRIFRRSDPREINAEQGFIIASIQRFVEPSLLPGLNKLMGDPERPVLRAVFERWQSDEKLREEILAGRSVADRKKIEGLFSRENFEDLSKDEQGYLERRIPPGDWYEALGVDEVRKRREKSMPAASGMDPVKAVKDNLPPDIYYRIQEKPFPEWTLNEVKEFARVMDDLTVSGKEIYKARLDADKRRITALQEGVRQTVRSASKPGLRDSAGDTPEERERKARKREEQINKYAEGAGGTAQAAARRRKLSSPQYSDMDAYRFARMLDGGDTNGKNSALLFKRRRDAYNQENAAIDARTEKVVGHMKKLGISETELWDKAIEVDLGEYLGKTIYTKAEVIGILSADRDDYSREAVMYGNMLDEAELVEYQVDGITEAELAELYEKAGERYSRVMKAIQEFMSQEGSDKYKKLMEAIDEDFQAGGERLSRALIQYNNRVMAFVQHYFPMIRTKPVSGRTAGAGLAKDLMAASSGPFSLYVEKGFTERRQSIPPQYQTPIVLDIMSVWTSAVKREEHFMAYGQLVKDLNAVYKGSRRVKDAIQRRYGQGAVDYINKYINLLTDPDSERVSSALDKFIRDMRGNTAAAYLGFKTSSIVKQYITSPWPFMAYMNPLEYWKTHIEFAAHPGELWRLITELSPYMKHRSANLLVDIVKRNAKNTFDRKAGALDKFNEIGMKGLEMVDRVCVAPGWLALYRKEYNRLSNDSNNTMSESDIMKTAALKADEITMLVQPSANPEDLAPLFRGNTELGRAFLQFTASLNVIWQNIRYDLPQMIAEKRLWNMAGTVIGYSVAGILLGAITSGFDDDDDAADAARKLVWWSTTQYTDAFPVIGGEVTRLLEHAVTGEMRWGSGMNILPTIGKIYSAGHTAISGIHEKDFGKLIKAAATAAEGAGIQHSLPVSGWNELLWAAGIGDGDGELGFHPEAFLGIRRRR